MTQPFRFDTAPLSATPIAETMSPPTHLGLPWAILPTALPAENTITPRAAAADQVGHRLLPQVQMIGQTAIIPISGMVLKGISDEDEYWYGACNLTRLDQMIANVKNDPIVKNVLFLIDSPGGVTIGVDTTARAIRELAQIGKRTIAYTESMCASAAYWLASACQRIVANPTAIIGSISTLTVAYDYSEMFAKNGITAKVFRTGELKGAGVMGKPWTPEEEQAVERRMSFIDGKFKDFITQNRPLDRAEMNGDYWYAENSPPGACDALADTLEDLLSTLI